MIGGGSGCSCSFARVDASVVVLPLAAAGAAEPTVVGVLGGEPAVDEVASRVVEVIVDVALGVVCVLIDVCCMGVNVVPVVLDVVRIVGDVIWVVVDD